MTINPIIPIPVMAIICVAIIAFKRKGVWPFVRQIVIALILFALNLRIMIPNDDVTVYLSEINANVIFVVDDTISMLAEDCETEEKTRLSAVTRDSAHIVDGLVGSDFSVISFHNTAQVLCPYNNDVPFVKNMIGSIYPLLRYSAKGTSLTVGSEALMQQLVRGRDKGGYNVVFFISDGESNIDEDFDTFGDLKKYIDNGAVLGYGTEAGGQMHIRSYEYDDDYNEIETQLLVTCYDSHYNEVPAVSKLNEDNLKSIAKKLGVKYVHMTSSSKIDDVIDDIMANVEVTTKETTEVGYDETYYYFAIALAVMLLVEAFFFWKKSGERHI